MSEGYCEVRREGMVIGHVGPHPRMPGYWMAVWKPKDIRDCGMKRFKTRRGAENRILRDVAANPNSADLPAATAARPL